jgi:hypothetical protein
MHAVKSERLDQSALSHQLSDAIRQARGAVSLRAPRKHGGPKPAESLQRKAIWFTRPVEIGEAKRKSQLSPNRSARVAPSLRRPVLVD